MNLHARAAAVAGVHLLGESPLEWFEGLTSDVPVEISCETNGPGDDLRLTLATGAIIEVQAKKGLGRGSDLWTALERLARGISADSIDFAALIVDVDATNTVRSDLKSGIVRLGQGRIDDLKDITRDFKHRLEGMGLSTQAVCSRLRIVVVHCALHDNATVRAAKSELRRLYGDNQTATTAWKAIESAAHDAIEQRGRWTAAELRGILQTAGLPSKLSGVKPATSSTGGIWRHLDPVSAARGHIEAFRRLYMATPESSVQSFGGREAEIKRLDDWLGDAAGPSCYLITAPTARGKSALLVRWTEQLADDQQWAVIFVPISLRFNTALPAVFYALLAGQLARALGVELASPTTDLESHYQGSCHALLQQAAASPFRLLIVVDALDEAQGAGFGADVFGSSFGPRVKVLVSARELVGDRGPQGWLTRLGWRDGISARSESLQTLDRDAVGPILEHAGVPMRSVSSALENRLMALSSGEPLLLALYAEDLSQYAREHAGRLEQALEGLSPGFSSYFAKAFDARSFEGNVAARDEINATLAVLSLALAPLEAADLTALVCRYANLSRPTAKDRFVTPLKRYIAGDGRPDRGYVLNHPKLSEYLREEKFDAVTLGRVNDSYVAWGRSVVNVSAANVGSSPPEYVLRRHVDHLSSAGHVALADIESLLAEGWRQAWLRADGDYIGYVDSLIRASASMAPSRSYASDAIQALTVRTTIALMSSSIKAQSTNVPSELLAQAVDLQEVTPRQAIKLINLQPTANRLGPMLDLLAHLSAHEREPLLDQVLAIPDRDSRYEYLARLAPSLSAQQRVRATDQVLAWVSADPQPRAGAIAAIAPALSKTVLADAARTAWNNALSLPEPSVAARGFVPLINALREGDDHQLSAELLEQCLSWIDTNPDPLMAANALAELAEKSSIADLADRAARLLPRVHAHQQAKAKAHSRNTLVWQIKERDHVATTNAALGLLELAACVTDSYMSKLTALAEGLVPGDYWSATAFLQFFPLIEPNARQTAAGLIAPKLLQLPSANNRTHSLTRLARFSDPLLRRSLIKRAMVDSRRIEDEFSRGRCLANLFSTLPSADKDREFEAMSADVRSIFYVLHRGELELQLSDQLPRAAPLAGVGLRNILSAEDAGNALSTLFREFARFQPDQRGAVFRLCWESLAARSDELVSFQYGMAATYAADQWTNAHLDFVRSQILPMSGLTLVEVLVRLLPVSTRLCAEDLVDAAFAAIALENDLNSRLGHLSRATQSLQATDPRQALLSTLWRQVADSEAPRIAQLIDSFPQLAVSDQRLLWPQLVDLARKARPAAHALARLSMMATSDIERRELTHRALADLPGLAIDQQLGEAAQVVATCGDADDIWQALDIMMSAAQTHRSNMLGALTTVSSALHSIGGPALTNRIMNSVRQVCHLFP